MIKEAFHSLYHDYQRSLFYWLTFLLTTLVIFVFFQVACSPLIGMSFIHSRNDVVSYLCVFVIFLCMFAVFFANDFYVKKKSKELAVQLVCGANFLQLTTYLLSQTLILFLLALPFSFLIGFLILMGLNKLMTISVFVSGEGMLVTIIVIVFEIFWCTILNLGYVYRSSIKKLIQGDRIIEVHRIQLPFHMNNHMKKGVAFVLFMVPIIFYYIYGDNPSSVIVFSVIGMIGISGCIHKIIIPFMDEWIQKNLSYHNQLVYLGFLRRDIKFMKNHIIFLIVSAVLIVSIFIMGLDNSMYSLLIFISFCVSHTLLSMTIMFRFSTEMLSRKHMFVTLQRIGYEYHQIQKIICKEVLMLYGLILCISLFYICHIFISLYLHQILSLSFIITMLVVYILPLLLCALLNIQQYLHQMKDFDKQLKS